MSTNIHTASVQWANRPPDERFWTVEDARCEADHQRRLSDERFGRGTSLQVHAEHDSIFAGEFALNSWSFGQLCSLVGAPSSFFKTRLAAQPKVVCSTLNAVIPDRGNYNLYLDTSYTPRLKSITSDSYKRIYNADVLSEIEHYAGSDWAPPPARPSSPGVETRRATESDVGLRGSDRGLSIKVGDEIGPSGVYLSDEDMFVFLVNPDNVTSPMDGEPLYQGIIVSNSEVGKASLKIETFLFRGVCGNHIIWDVEAVQKTRLRHVGKNPDKFWRYLEQAFTTGGPGNAIPSINKALSYQIGTKLDDIMNEVSKVSTLSKSIISKAMAASVPDLDGPSGSLWGIINGLTRVSQGEINADRRHEIDTEAGRLLSLVA